MISFFLQSGPLLRRGHPASLVVKEMFKFRGGDPRILPSGIIQANERIGMVDNDIKAQNPKEYAKFAEFYAANKLRLDGEANKISGSPYVFDYEAKAPEVIEVKVVQAKGKTFKNIGE